MASIYEIFFSIASLFGISLFIFLCLMAIWLVFEILKNGLVWDAAISHIIQHNDMTLILFFVACGAAYVIADHAGFFHVLFGVGK